MNLQPSENSLQGAVIMSGGKPVFDATANRITWLIQNQLQHITDDDSGWIGLYRDPADGRLWERSFVQSGQHGGGAPSLNVIDVAEAKNKYKFDSNV